MFFSPAKIVATNVAGTHGTAANNAKGFGNLFSNDGFCGGI